MPTYTSNPVPLYVARQINDQGDLDDWIAELTTNEVGPKDDYTVLDLEGTVNPESNEFLLEYVLLSQVDGPQRIRSEWALGSYVIANGQYISQFWAESEANFNSRFQPHPEQG